MGPQQPPGSPIFLIGFMGAGKTTVGRVLARKVNYQFRDLDEIIEVTAGKSVREIFLESGESEFRRLESNAIESCRALNRSIVALGGGAFCTEKNRRSITEIGTSIWLDCRLDVCLARAGGDLSRPLAGSDTEMRDLLESRLPAYRLADFTVRTDDMNPGEIASEIAALLRAAELIGEY